MTDREVLQMPIRRFWLMYSNISRITAQENIVQLNILRQSQNADRDSYEKFTKSLIAQVGEVETIEPDPVEGLAKLKALSRRING